MTSSPCESICADLLSTRNRGATLANARTRNAWLASAEHARTRDGVWRASRTQRWPGRRSRSSCAASGGHSRATRSAHLRRHGSRQPVSPGPILTLVKPTVFGLPVCGDMKRVAHLPKDGGLTVGSVRITTCNNDVVTQQ